MHLVELAAVGLGMLISVQLAGMLPGGRVVEATHVGPYDTMEATYGEVQQYLAQSGLTPGDVMWESYLSDPELETDPATWRTQICWPVD